MNDQAKAQVWPRQIFMLDHSDSNVEVDLRGRGYLGDDGTEAAPSDSPSSRGSDGSQSCSKDSSQCQRQCNWKRRSAELGARFLSPADSAD